MERKKKNKPHFKGGWITTVQSILYVLALGEIPGNKNWDEFWTNWFQTKKDFEFVRIKKEGVKKQQKNQKEFRSFQREFPEDKKSLFFPYISNCFKNRKSIPWLNRFPSFEKNSKSFSAKKPSFQSFLEKIEIS